MVKLEALSDVILPPVSILAPIAPAPFTVVSTLRKLTSALVIIPICFVLVPASGSLTLTVKLLIFPALAAKIPASTLLRL